MKKFILVLVLLFVLIPNVWAKSPSYVKDAETLSIYMRKQIIYGNDRVIPGYFEYFQMPVILEHTRVGDCDDQALLSWYYLAQMGYVVQPYTLIMDYDNDVVGHAITVFLDKDKTFSVFSNQLIFKTLKTDPIEAIKDVYPNWRIIFNWIPTKFGYLTAEEVYADFIPVDFRSIKIKAIYYLEILKDKVLDYVDY